jgi:hypothetical protein
VRLGTTAFSFTNEWLARRYTLEGLLRRVAELDLGPAIELIGFQTWRDFPRLSTSDVVAFRRLTDDLGLEPAALGAYVDLHRRVDGRMSTSEAVDFLAPQIGIAGALGFPLLRLHGGVPVDVLERVAPLAEAAGVVLATEIQGPQTPADPAVATVLECLARVETATIALALDFSVAMTSVPRAFVAALHRLGIEREELDGLIARWAEGAPLQELFGAIDSLRAPAAARDEARAGFVRFGRQDPESWLTLVPHIAYAHAKFWDAEPDADEPVVRTPELIDVLRRGGYEGVVASEWGGNAWLDVDDVDAFEVVRRQHELYRDLISKPAVEVPA